MSMRWIDALAGDLRFARRYFARNKATTGIVVAVLALGIGANTTIFSALQAEFRRPAPGMPDDDRLVRLWSMQRATPTARWDERDFTGAELRAIAERRDVFSAVTGYVAHDVALSGPDSTGPHGVRAQFVTANHFGTIGVHVTGPGFNLRQDDAAADMAAIMSYDWAERMFGTPIAAVGQLVLVNEQAVRVVGVAPPRFQGARRNSQRPALWIPLSARVALTGVPASRLDEEPALTLVARLAPAVSHEQGTTAVHTVVTRMLPDSAARVGLARSGQTIDLEAIPPGPDSLEVLVTATAIGIIGLLVLLVTCTNVSSLMVAAATGRRHEVAVRLSLGASRVRIIGQLLTESVLLTMTSGAVGLLLYWWLSTVLSRSVRGVDLGADVGTLGFTMLLAIGTGILFGLSPALHTTRGNVGAALRGSGAGATSRSRLQRVFVTAQIVLSQPLLVLLAIMLSLGIAEYRPTERALAERLIRVNFRVPEQEGGPSQLARRVDALVPRLEERPEVRGVIAEPAGYALRYVTVRTASGADSTTLLRMMAAQPGYFEQMDMRVVLGRGPAFTDTNAADPGIVVGSQFARRVWGEASPVGRTLVSTRSADEVDADTIRALVVGVYEQPATVGADDVMRVYTAHLGRWRRDGLVIRTHGPAESFVPQLRTLVQSAAPGLPVSRMQTQAQIDDEERDIAMRVSALAGAAGVVALLLASLGLYGVVSLAVRQRTREIGIRVAVGAAPSRVARMFLASGMRIGVIALLLGLPICVIGLHLLLSNQALIAPSLDPWRIGAAIAAILLSVVALASWIPARRATRVDPAATLRME